MPSNIFNKIDNKTLAIDAAGALGGAGAGYLLSRLLHRSPSGGRSLLYSLLGAVAGATGAHYGQSKYGDRIDAALASAGIQDTAKTDKKRKNNPLHTGIAAGVGAGAGELALGSRFATTGRRLTSVLPGFIDPRLNTPALYAHTPDTVSGPGFTFRDSVPGTRPSAPKDLTVGSKPALEAEVIPPGASGGIRGLRDRLGVAFSNSPTIDSEGNLTTERRMRLGTVGGHAVAAATGAGIGVGAQLLGSALYRHYGDRTNFAANRSKKL